MRSRIALFAIALVLSTAALAAAQSVESGTVVRVDPQSSVVVLDDGRMYRVTPNTMFMVDNRPAAFTVLRAGDRVVIQSAEPVVFREGRYVAMTAPVAAPAPGTVIAQAPPPPPAPAQMTVPIGVRQTIYGTITDVDRDGKIKIKTDRDSFEARVAPEALRQIKKGDNVIIDLTISPPGAAAPRR
jgi:intein/homing endonuclease